jgi:hypothetical protein
MKKPLFSLLLVLCCLVALVQPSSCVQAQEGYAGSRQNLVTFFWGIVSHTRWPDKDVDRPLRVCLPENNGQAALIRESAQNIPVRLRHPVVIHTFLPGAACDVVYFPTMSGDGADLVLRSFIEQPVLTIGEGSAFCSTGGMFCLLPDNDGTINKFAANLDVISRSKLQINPQVLRLSKHLQEH